MKSIQSLRVLIWKYFMTYFSNEKGKFWKGLYNIIEYLQNIHINQCFPTTNFVCVIGGSLIQTWVSESPQLGLLFLSVLLYAPVSLLRYLSRMSLQEQAFTLHLPGIFSFLLWWFASRSSWDDTFTAKSSQWRSQGWLVSSLVPSNLRINSFCRKKDMSKISYGIVFCV